MKNIELPWSMQYDNLSGQQGEAGFHHNAERLNPAFVADQSH